MRVEFRKSNHSYWLGEKKLISITQLLKKHGLSTDYTGVDAEVLQRAAQKGTMIHKEIENYINSGAVGFTSEFMDFIDIADSLELSELESEVILPCDDIPENEIDNYVCAGTADILCTSKNGKTIIDIKTTANVNKRACAWQLSLYEKLSGRKFDKLYIFHLGANSRPIEIERIPEAEVDRLLECERNGEIYQEPGLIVTGDLIACAEAAERELKLAEATAKTAKETAEKYRQQLYVLMTEQGVDSWETLNKSLLITRVAPSTKPTIDSARLKADLPEIAEKYTKISNVKGYVRITVREG
jgi:hypothetical protein